MYKEISFLQRIYRMEFTRKINTLGKANKIKLVRAFGFSNINVAVIELGDGQIIKRKQYSEETKHIAYRILQEKYNELVDVNQTTKKNDNKIKRKEKRETVKEANTIKTFIVLMECEMLYKKEEGYYEPDLKKKRFAKGATRKFSDVSPVLQDKDPKSWAEAFVRDDYEFDDHYRKLTVLSYKIQISANQPTERKPPSKQVMKRADVLHNDWLRFGEGIAESAYQNHEGYCVYRQLTDYMLNPVTMNAQKFVGDKRTSEDSLFEFFNHYIETHELEYDYPDFSKESGVSTEMIKALCIELKRSMYAFDADTKLFDSYVEKKSNYTPIVFYKLHDHFYLVNNPSVIKSMSEVAKPANIKIISSTLQNEEKELIEKPVIHLEYFDVSTAHELNADNLYLVTKNELDEEMIEFIRTHKDIPKIKTTNACVSSIQFRENFVTAEKKKEQRWVTVAVDVTAKEKYNYEDVKKIAELNNIPYVNEGFGSLVLSALKPDRCNRVNLTDEEKKMYNVHFWDRVPEGAHYKFISQTNLIAKLS